MDAVINLIRYILVFGNMCNTRRAFSKKWQITVFVFVKNALKTNGNKINLHNSAIFCINSIMFKLYN